MYCFDVFSGDGEPELPKMDARGGRKAGKKRGSQNGAGVGARTPSLHSVPDVPRTKCDRGVCPQETETRRRHFLRSAEPDSKLPKYNRNPENDKTSSKMTLIITLKVAFKRRRGRGTEYTSRHAFPRWRGRCCF